MSDRHPNVTNIDEIEWLAGLTHGSRFDNKSKPLGVKAGGKSLGCTLYEVPPGKRAFPLHAHLANEEAIYVLEGEGTMRIGESRVPVRAGDYVAFPPGPQSPHQLVNTSNAPLRYLCLSTMRYPEIALYPDSGKIGLRALSPALRMVFKQSSAGVTPADYFEGESGDHSEGKKSD